MLPIDVEDDTSWNHRRLLSNTVCRVLMALSAITLTLLVQTSISLLLDKLVWIYHFPSCNESLVSEYDWYRVDPRLCFCCLMFGVPHTLVGPRRTAANDGGPWKSFFSICRSLSCTRPLNSYWDLIEIYVECWDELIGMVYPMVACNRKKKVVLIATLILLSVLNVSLQINTQFTFSGFFSFWWTSSKYDK